MQGSLEEPPIVVRTSRTLSAIGTMVCGVIVYIDCISLSHRGWAEASGPYNSLFLFGLGLIYFGWQLIDPMMLILAPDGLTWRSSFVSRHWRWMDIGNFRTMLHAFVACDLGDKNFVTGWLRPINKRLAGSHGSFGFGWEMRAPALVDLLNAARARWLQPE